MCPGLIWFQADFLLTLPLGNSVYCVYEQERREKHGELSQDQGISVKYNISARTLRYYEDMGLIESTRSDGYAYRLYDEAAIRRLEQILILRRLNISIKDIKSIFSTASSEVVLDVLEKRSITLMKRFLFCMN